MADAEQTVADQVVATFRRVYPKHAPFREDQELVDELSLELRPVVESLLTAGLDDEVHMQQHEALAMATLLGRSAGKLGATPTAVFGVMLAMTQGFASARRSLPQRLEHTLQTLVAEGYAQGRDERHAAEATQRQLDAIPVLEVAPRVVALILCGDHEPEVLGPAVDRLGRRMLETDAQACIVEMAALQRATPDRAAEVFGAEAAARMLGAACVFSGATEAWREAGQKAGAVTELLQHAPTFADALNRALQMVDMEVRRRSRWKRRRR